MVKEPKSTSKTLENNERGNKAAKNPLSWLQMKICLHQQRTALSKESKIWKYKTLNELTGKEEIYHSLLH